MRLFILILAIGALAACNDNATGDTETDTSTSTLVTPDTSSVYQDTSSAMTPDTTSN